MHGFFQVKTSLNSVNDFKIISLIPSKQLFSDKHCRLSYTKLYCMNTSANLQILPIDDKCKVVYKAAFM